MNFALGQSYTVVHRETAHERFKEDFKRYFDSDIVYDSTINAFIGSEGVYAFVGSEGGENIYPLYEGQKAYIMTETASTFSNLTLKK